MKNKLIDSDNSKYWDDGLQLIDGCTPVNDGCRHCWSAAAYIRQCLLDGRTHDALPWRPQ